MHDKKLTSCSFLSCVLGKMQWTPRHREDHGSDWKRRSQNSETNQHKKGSWYKGEFVQFLALFPGASEGKCRTPVWPVLLMYEGILGMTLASLHNTQQFLPVAFPSHALAMAYPGVCNSLPYYSTQFRVLCNKLHIGQALGRNTVPPEHVTENRREGWRERERNGDGKRERERWDTYLEHLKRQTDLPNRGGFCSCLCFTKHYLVVKRFVVKDILSEFSPHFRFADLVLF